MPDWSGYAAFIVASLALLVTPGPAVLYVVARSVDQGRRAGIVSVVGLHVGTLFHVAAAALGISAILVSSALAFNVVKLLGAAYLIYLGIQKFRERGQTARVAVSAPQKEARIFYQGVVVNLLNPKLALFFFAFLPQFVDPARGAVAGQIVLLGCTFVILGLCSDSAYALLAGTARHWLRGNTAFLRGQRYFAGGVYITLGVATALSGSESA
ncbi:MAG: LysE family translocator [Anaerolineae bacterium]